MKTLLLILGGAYIIRKLMRKNYTGLLSDPVVSVIVVNFDSRDEKGRVECNTTFTDGVTEQYFYKVDMSLYKLIEDAFRRGVYCVAIIRDGERKDYYSFKELNPFEYFSPILPDSDKRRKL